MAYTVEITPKAEKQLRDLDKGAQRQVEALIDRIEERDDPRSLGEALKGAFLGEFWKYRAGDYRIVCSIEDHRMVVLALEIGNRKDVYKKAKR